MKIIGLFILPVTLMTAQASWALPESRAYPFCEHDGVEVTVDAYPPSPSEPLLQTKNNLHDLPDDMEGRYLNTRHFGQVQVGFFPGPKAKTCKGAVRLHGAPLSVAARHMGFDKTSSGLYERNLEAIRSVKGLVKYDRWVFVSVPMIVDRFECIDGQPFELPIERAPCADAKVLSIGSR